MSEHSRRQQRLEDSLEDIIDNIARIERYVAGLNTDDLSGDELRHDAVERCLERICEVLGVHLIAIEIEREDPRVLGLFGWVLNGRLGPFIEGELVDPVLFGVRDIVRERIEHRLHGRLVPVKNVRKRLQAWVARLAPCDVGKSIVEINPDWMRQLVVHR